MTLTNIRSAAAECESLPVQVKAAQQCDVTLGNQSLETLAVQFQSIAQVSDDYAIAAAFIVRDMRTLVESGGAGPGITWYSWALKTLNLPPQRIRRYLRIADAPDPRAMRDELLRQDRERAKKSRKKRKEIDPERKELIDWARRAKIEKVRAVLLSLEMSLTASKTSKQTH